LSEELVCFEKMNIS